MVQLSTSWQLLNSRTITYYSSFTGTFELWAKYSTQEIANNRTKVQYSWYMTLNSGWVTSYDAQNYLTNVGWDEATYREYTSSQTLRTWEGWINHNADGTGGGSCTGRTRMGGMGLDTGDVSASYTLPTIPRASQPTASPNPITIKNATNTLTVNSNRKASSFTHTIKIQVGSWSLQNTGVGASTTFNIPYSVIAQFSATSKTATGTITCITYSGSTNIGTKTANFTLQVDSATDHANIGTITTADTNPTTSAIIGAGQMVYGQSTLEATIPLTVSGSYTELASAKVTCGNTTQNYTLSGTSQTVTFTKNKVDVSSLTVTVTDKRGNSVTGTATWTLLPYQPLTLTGTVGRPSATGSTATGQVTGTAYGGTYGNTANSLNISYEWKLHSDANYTAGTDTYTQTIADGQQNYTQAMTFAEAFDYQNQYDIRFTVSDLFSTATYTCQLMQGLPILSWDETEVDVFGDLHIHDRTDPYICQNVMDGFDAVNEYGGVKNLLPVAAVTTTVNGITFTVNSDGTIKANGTASGLAQLSVGMCYAVTEGEDYALNGCPSGGSASTYYSRFTFRNSSGTAIEIDGVPHQDEFGDGIVRTAPSGTAYVQSYIQVVSGATVNNIVFKPMIRDARYANETYQQHAMTNLELTYYHYTREIKLTVNSSYVSSSNLYALQIGDNMVMVTGWITVNSSVTGSRTLFYLPTGLVAVINTLVVSWDTTNNTPEMFYIGNGLNYFTSRRALTSGHTYQFSQIVMTRKS